MVDESQRYNLGAVRDLLMDAFNAEELRDLFYFAQTPELQAVPDKFAEGDGLPTMVRKAVRYCDSRYLLGEMLAEVKAANPRAYERHEALLEASPAPQPALAPTPKPDAAPAPSKTPTRTLGRFPVWGLVAALVVVIAALAVVVVLLLGPEPEPAPTATEQALVTDTPAERTATDTPEPLITAELVVTPTLAVTPIWVREYGYEYDPQLVVVYTGTDGVSIRNGPGTGYPEVAVAYANEWLSVVGASEKQGVMRWWPVQSWRVYSEDMTGWVAEWTADPRIRLVKPVLNVDDEVMVVNPSGSGAVALWENCDNKLEVEWGTELTVIGMPDATICGDRDETISGTGRQWWLVETPEGRQGWVADFRVDSEPDEVNPLQIAPLWYWELTAPTGSTW